MLSCGVLQSIESAATQDSVKRDPDAVKDLRKAVSSYSDVLLSF